MSTEERSDFDGSEHEFLNILEPLVSVSQLERSELPIVSLTWPKVNSLELVGLERAKNGIGGAQNHVTGILGEYAAAKYFGITDRVDLEVYDGGDGGYDFIHNGKKIDVKTAGMRVNNPSLTVSTNKPLRADIYLLVHQINRANYRIIGYANKLRVKKSSTFTYSKSKDLWPEKYGDEVFIVEQNKLWPIP